MLNILPPLARLGGITKRTKIDRFGEQGYAFLYFLCMSVYGLVSTILLSLPSYNLIKKKRLSCLLPKYGGIVQNTFG